MKKSFIILLICIAQGSIVFAQNNKTINKKTHPITIITPDTAIKAEVLTEISGSIANKKLTYYWYSNSNNLILHTVGGHDGKLLHGTFTSYYGNKNLMVKGKFNKGLKNGEWIKWYSNGKINEVSKWRSGFKQGKYKLYNEQGEVMLEAHFKKDQMDGRVISYQNGKVVNKKKYRNGQEVPEKFLKEKKTFSLKNVFKKKQKTDTPTKKDKTLKEKKPKKETQPKKSKTKEPDKKKVQTTSSRS